MSKLSVDQKSIYNLFSSKKSDFLIPDYQRPYAWGIEECETLWNDLFSFAIPEEDKNNFDSENDEYYLGPIVTYQNKDKKFEVIDGQQRLTTILLLLRAFYDKFRYAQDDETKATRRNIEQCIWKTNEFDKPDLNRLKIDSEVATDEDKDEFLSILKTGTVSPKNRSFYAKNFQFFKGKVQELVEKYPTYTCVFAIRVIKNAILLPIEADSMETALRIFSTLNDRGLPLSDADIFKAKFYKFFQSTNKKDDFIQKWKNLEVSTKNIFGSDTRVSSNMDELFTRYMYFERARMGVKETTTPSLRSFYTEKCKDFFKKESSFEGLSALADFWNRVYSQDVLSFSSEVLKRLYILDKAPNGMWAYITSVYFLKNKRDDGSLDNDAFIEFLDKIIGFILGYAFIRPGVNALRTPIYPEMVKLVQGKTNYFEENKISEKLLRDNLYRFEFSNQRRITRSLLVWWLLSRSDQQYPQLYLPLHIEHIYAKKRNEVQPLSDPSLVESVGNKALLEDSINIRASDYRFRDKTGYYVKSCNAELSEIGGKVADFNEEEIIRRKELILDGFIEHLRKLNLLSD